MLENPFKQVELYKSLEVLKEESIKRLNGILYKPLTVENIESFADEAVSDTIELINDLLHEYKTNPNLEGNLSLNTQEQEDDVCKKLELPNISEILDRIQEVKAKIDAVKISIQGSKEKTETIITPPDQLENQGIIPGDTPFEKKKFIPRLLTLMYILETDFDIDIRDIEQMLVLEGEVKDEMIRKTPYVRVIVPELNRAVYICDEEGNASYVFDTQKLQELHIQLDDLDIDGKQDKNSLIAMYPGIGVRIIQTLNWRNKIKIYLEEELPEQEGSISDEALSEGFLQSEFFKRERVKHLPYEDWSEEVKIAWDETSDKEKKGDIEKWYNKKRKSHNAWPSSKILKIKYSPYGFTTLTTAVGRENHLDKDYLPYEDWSREVKDARGKVPEHEKQRDMEDWYGEEKRVNHNKTWPSYSRLKKRYSIHGFKSVNDVVGKDNYRDKDYLPYEDWLKEVVSAWSQLPENERPRSLWSWYEQERKREHSKTWPKVGSLKEKYSNFGRKPFYDLIGKEKYKMTFLQYEDWAEEVRDAWNKIPEGYKPTNIIDWYTEERKKHDSKWPGPSILKNKYQTFGFRSLNDVL